MALDLSTLLTPGQSYGGLPYDQAMSILQSYRNQLTQNPQNAAKIQSDMQEMFGPQISQAIIGDAAPQLNQSQVTVQNGAEAPTSVAASSLLNNPQTPTDNPLPSAPNTSTNPAGGLYQDPNALAYGNSTTDMERLLSEAEMQKNLGKETLDSQAAARTKYLGDLSTLLQQQQAQQLTTELPGMYEDLNSRGLLRSSALGDKLSLRQEDLAKITSNQLAQQGLSYADQYTTGLGDIENSYLGARNNALSRQFNLEDLNTNIKASKELGFALQPQPQSTGKSSLPLSAGLSGASIGGSVGGPIGAVIGATAGAGAAKSSSGK